MRTYDFMSVTALLVDGEGKFLLQLRDDRPDIVNPGLWGSFGGRVEPHETDEAETPDEALLRELEEELAWQPPHFELYTAGAYRSLPDEDDRGQLVYVYAAPVDVPLEKMTLGEGQAMASFAADALPERIVPALRALIARFAQEPMYGEMMRRAGLRHSTDSRSIYCHAMPASTRAIFAPEERGGTSIRAAEDECRGDPGRRTGARAAAAARRQPGDHVSGALGPHRRCGERG